MIKQLIATVLLMYGTCVLMAQENIEAKHGFEMKQLNPNLKETNAILIFDDPKSTYQLELKDNKPVNGYEISSEALLGEFNLVNYYKDGELLAKYAIDYLQMEDQAVPIRYTLKTTYQNGKAIDGNVYKELPNGVVLIDQYKHGSLSGFAIDLFAMHYFNRLNFQLNKDVFTIHNLQSNNELRIYKKEGLLHADFYQEEERVATSKKRIQKIDRIQANSSTIYYINAAQTLGEFYCIATTPDDLDAVDDNFLAYIFAQFSFDFSGDMQEVLTTARSAVSNFGTMNKNDLGTLFNNLIFPYPEENFLGFLVYDSDAQPWEGTAIKALNGDQYEVTVYENGKVQSTKIVDELNELRITY